MMEPLLEPSEGRRKVASTPPETMPQTLAQAENRSRRPSCFHPTRGRRRSFCTEPRFSPKLMASASPRETSPACTSHWRPRPSPRLPSATPRTGSRPPRHPQPLFHSCDSLFSNQLIPEKQTKHTHTNEKLQAVPIAPAHPGRQWRKRWRNCPSESILQPSTIA